MTKDTAIVLEIYHRFPFMEHWKFYWNINFIILGLIWEWYSQDSTVVLHFKWNTVFRF